MDAFERAERLVQVLMKDEQEPTPETIRANVAVVLQMLQREGKADGIDPEALAKDLETKFNVWVDQLTFLHDPTGHEAWLPNRRTQIDWRFWKRYERYLEEEKGIAPPMVK